MHSPIRPDQNASSRQPACLAPGLALALVLALAASWIGRAFPLVGGAVSGIVLGLLVRQAFSPGPRFAPGIAFAGSKVLQWSVMTLGFGLSLAQVAKVGLESLSVTLVTGTMFLAAASCTKRPTGTEPVKER